MEAPFISRRGKFVEELRRRATPAAAALRAGEREAAAAIVGGVGGVAFAAAVERSDDKKSGGGAGSTRSVRLAAPNVGLVAPSAGLPAAPVTLRRRENGGSGGGGGGGGGGGDGGVFENGGGDIGDGGGDVVGNGAASAVAATAAAAAAAAAAGHGAGERALVDATCGAALAELFRLLPAVAALPSCAWDERAAVVNAVAPVGAAVSAALEGRIDALGRRTAVDRGATGRALGREPPPVLTFSAACMVGWCKFIPKLKLESA